MDWKDGTDLADSDDDDGVSDGGSDGNDGSDAADGCDGADDDDRAQSDTDESVERPESSADLPDNVCALVCELIHSTDTLNSIADLMSRSQS